MPAETLTKQRRRDRWIRLQGQLDQRNLVMGILNVTPDSFSDGGTYLDPSRGIERGLEMVEEGADLIDVGGESSRPGAREISVQEELDRIVPVIEGIRGRTDILISVDTYKEAVAHQAFDSGADIVNDITAGRHSPQLPGWVFEQGGGLILMHMRGNPRTMQTNTDYEDVVNETLDFLRNRVESVCPPGLPRDSLWVDPGIGFGKSAEGNLRILSSLRKYDSLGVPVVVGLSRKSFIGNILDRDLEGRLPATVALTGAIARNGVHRVHRVHDVSAVRDCLRIVEALNRERER